MRPIVRALCVMLLASGLHGGEAAAQTRPGMRAPGRVPALVAIADSTPGGAEGFLIVRIAGSAPLDVILLGPNADPGVLTRAVEALLAARRQTGNLAASSSLLRSSGSSHRPYAGGARAVPWGERVLSDARAAPSHVIPGVGRVRSVRIWIPATRAR